MEGNVTLTASELDSLRQAIVKMFVRNVNQFVGDAEKVFNTNWKSSSYKKLIEDIVLKTGSSISGKVLSGIMFTSRFDINQRITIRRKTADALCLYAFDYSIDQFLIENKIPFEEMKEFENLAGYWECYLDKDGHFQDELIVSKSAKLNRIAFWINGATKRDSFVRYYETSKIGKGFIDIKGSNVVFNLTNDKTSEPMFLIMNFGRNIKDSSSHFNLAAGIYGYIGTDTGSPLCGNCVMIHRPKAYWELSDTEARTKFIDTLEIKITDERFGNGDNLMENTETEAGSAKMDKEDSEIMENLKNFFGMNIRNSLSLSVIEYNSHLIKSRARSRRENIPV